jgi:thioredoxin 1
MSNVPESDKIITLTNTNFNHQTRSGVVLVDFWAGWCMPCKMLAPIINEVAEEVDGVAKVGKVDVEVQREVASRYSIRSIPTLIIFKDGKEVKRFVGAKTKDYLVKQIRLA